MEGRADGTAGRAVGGAGIPAATPRLSPSLPLGRAAGILAGSPLPFLPVTDGEGRLAGTLSRGDVDALLRDVSLQERVPEEEALLRLAAADAMDRRPVTLLPGDGEEEAEELLSRLSLPAAAVTDGEGRFLSIFLPRPRRPGGGGSPG